MKNIRVFIASPSELAPERALFFEDVARLGGSKCNFVPLGYELVHAQTGQRPQERINTLVDGCDVFVLVLHKRWGQQATDSAGVTSYTEEEFRRALSRYNRTRAPFILCFFKNIDIDALADPGPQLARVLEFRRTLEQSRKVLYRTFNSEAEFIDLLRKHLSEFAHSGAATSEARSPVLLPVPADERPDEARTRDVALAQSAIQAAASGHLEEAEQLFAALSQTTVTTSVLQVAHEFFRIIGNEHAAQTVLDRKLAILRDRRIAAHEYISALASTGWVEGMIHSRLAITNSEDRPEMESILRRLFGPVFNQMMIESLADNFTLGELRILTRFYTGEGATISGKMGEYMGRVLPRFLADLEGRFHRGEL